MMEFFHPYIAVSVNDLSEYYEEVSGGGTVLYQPFISDKGEENVLSTEYSLATTLNKYGKPNFARHGQPYYNMIEWIKSGGRVLAHRIMPADACYSHMILNVKTAAAYVPMYEREANSAINAYALDVDGERIQWKLGSAHQSMPYEFVAPNTPTIESFDEVVAFKNPMIKVSAYVNTDPQSTQTLLEARIYHGSESTVIVRDGDFSKIRLENLVPGETYKVKVRYATGQGANKVYSEYSGFYNFVVDENATLDPNAVNDEEYIADEFTPVWINVGTDEKPDVKKFYKDDEDLLYTDGIKVKHEIVYISSCTSDNDLSADSLLELTNARNAADKSSEDWDGYKSHYILGLRSKGKGVFGDLQRVSLKLNKLYANTYNYRIYELTGLEFDSEFGTTNVIEGPFEFSFYPDALTTANTSLNAQYVIDNAFNFITGHSSEEVYDMLIADIEAAVKNSNSNDESWDDTSSIDFLFGQSLSGYGLYEKLVIDDDSVALETSAGINFKNGSLGSFSTANKHIDIDPATGLPRPGTEDGKDYVYIDNTPDYVRTTKNKLYVEAYQGITIPDIMSTKFYPVDVVMDANFDLLVKNAILDFCNERKYHTFGYIDTGILYSVAQTLKWRENDFQFTDWCVSIYGQNWVAQDDYTGKDMNVTTTYFLAGIIPDHDKTFGVHKPIAGPNYGLLEGYKLNKSTSWFPTEHEKEDLYTARINYVERQPNQVRFMSQCTAQKKLTQLTEQNNVRVLFKMVQTVEDILDGFYFEAANSATLASISSTLTSSLKSWVSMGACDYVDAVASQTAEQRERKICGVRIGVKFTPVIERFDCVFEVRR